MELKINEDYSDDNSMVKIEPGKFFYFIFHNQMIFFFKLWKTIGRLKLETIQIHTLILSMIHCRSNGNSLLVLCIEIIKLIEKVIEFFKFI